MGKMKRIPELVRVNGKWVLDQFDAPSFAHDYHRDYVGKTSTLYIIGCAGYHKVGLTRNFENRFVQLDFSNPLPVTRVATRTVPLAGVAYAEAWLHRELAPYHHKGEWFAVEAAAALALLPKAVIRARVYDRYCSEWRNPYVPTPADIERGKKWLADFEAKRDYDLAAEYHNRFAGRKPPVVPWATTLPVDQPESLPPLFTEGRA